MAKVCNDCWEKVRGDQYFPETFNPGDCDSCGNPAFVARVTKAEVQEAKDAMEHDRLIWQAQQIEASST